MNLVNKLIFWVALLLTPSFIILPLIAAINHADIMVTAKSQGWQTFCNIYYPVVTILFGVVALLRLRMATSVIALLFLTLSTSAQCVDTMQIWQEEIKGTGDQKLILRQWQIGAEYETAEWCWTMEYFSMDSISLPLGTFKVTSGPYVANYNATIEILESEEQLEIPGMLGFTCPLWWGVRIKTKKRQCVVLHFPTEDMEFNIGYQYMSSIADLEMNEHLVRLRNRDRQYRFEKFMQKVLAE